MLQWNSEDWTPLCFVYMCVMCTQQILEDHALGLYEPCFGLKFALGQFSMVFEKCFPLWHQASRVHVLPEWRPG